MWVMFMLFIKVFCLFNICYKLRCCEIVGTLVFVLSLLLNFLHSFNPSSKHIFRKHPYYTLRHIVEQIIVWIMMLSGIQNIRTNPLSRSTILDIIYFASCKNGFRFFSLSFCYCSQIGYILVDVPVAFAKNRNATWEILLGTIPDKESTIPEEAS